MIYLSFSAYDTYKTCPLLYRFQKEYPLRANYAEFEVGKFLHRYFYRSLMNRKMEITPEEAWENIKGDKRIIQDFDVETTTPDELMEEYRALGNHIIMRRDEKFYIDRIEVEMKNSAILVDKIHAKSMDFEKKIMEKYDENIGFLGYIDILFNEKIGEVKTGFGSDRDKEQLKFYSLLFYLKNYRIMEGSLIYLLTGEMRDSKFKVEEIEKLLEDAVNVANEINNENFPPKPGDACNYCPYKNICEFS